MLTPRTEQGLTLMELMLAAGVAGLLLAAAVPAFDSLFEKHRLNGAAEEVAASARVARVAALSRGAPVTVSVMAGTPWCVALSETGPCDCGGHGDDGTNCRLDGADYIVRGGRYDGIDLLGEDLSVTFPPVLEVPRSVSESWRLMLESEGGQRVGVAMTLLGEVYLCDPGEGYGSPAMRRCP